MKSYLSLRKIFFAINSEVWNPRSEISPPQGKVHWHWIHSNQLNIYFNVHGYYLSITKIPKKSDAHIQQHQVYMHGLILKDCIQVAQMGSSRFKGLYCSVSSQRIPSAITCVHIMKVTFILYVARSWHPSHNRWHVRSSRWRHW